MSTVKDTNYLLCGLALLLFAAGIYFTPNRRWNYILFGLLWFMAFIIPSLLTSYFGGLEHRSYLSMIGLFICFSEFEIFKLTTIKKYKYIIPSILLFFVGITLYRLPIFDNALNYWESAVKTSDNSSLSCLNLGKTHESIGQYQKAIDSYQEGLKRNPKEQLIHNDIGGALIYLKRYDEAEIEFKKELELYPKSALAYFNLGLSKKLTGKIQEAVPYWKKSIEFNKNFIQPYQQLADYYKSVNDTANFNSCLKEITRLR